MRILLLVLLVFAKINVLAQTKCASERWNSQKFDYCFTPGSGAKAQTLMYFFSGVTNDEKGWQQQRYPRALQKHWRDLKLGSPAVLNIAVGRVWLAVHKNSSAKSGLLEPLLANFSSLEKKFFPQGPQDRWIMGDSMGGHNMWQIVFSKPNYFTKVVSMCAAIMSQTPYMTSAELREYTTENEGQLLATTGAQELYQAYYPSTEVWQNENPLARAQQLTQRTQTQYLIVSVPKDIFSFTPGSTMLAHILAERDEAVTRVLLPGSHCVPNDLQEVTQFLF